MHVQQKRIEGTPPDPPTYEISYLHGDLTRSTMMTTDESGSAVSRPTYTAFGEPVTYDAVEGWQVGFPEDIGTRYGYDGGWGYESGLITLWGEDTSLPPVTLQHVGERWYQPALGRFVQRDPIGSGGGINTYRHVGNMPTIAVDPDGEFLFIAIGIAIVGTTTVMKGIETYWRWKAIADTPRVQLPKTPTNRPWGHCVGTVEHLGGEHRRSGKVIARHLDHGASVRTANH